MNDAKPSLRFPRVHRISRSGDFSRIYREGSRARGGLMTVVVLPNGTPHTRLGLSVGKRCWRKAVKRNRVRRVFREAFRTALPELPPGLDVVVIASEPEVAPTLEGASQELVRMAAKALRRYRERTEASERGSEP